MRKPIYCRPRRAAEREQLQAGLRATDVFVLRRCQILLASDRGESVPQIARRVGYDEQTVRNVIHTFNAVGQAVLTRLSRGPTPSTGLLGLPRWNGSKRCCTRVHGS